MPIEHNRLKIQQQKELPTLSPAIQRILAACEDRDISQAALAEVLAEAPTIAARLLGLANSAFFGQAGRVHSLPHAITVLGMVTVRSVAAGLALSSAFDTRRCPAFRPERYWLSAVLTAAFARELAPHVAAGVRPPLDSVYLAGLLHNIGLLALVHLYPAQMQQALTAYAAAPARPLGAHIRDVLAMDHYQAGVWLGAKWHFPRDLLLVMEHHYDRAYRGDHWPLVLVEGLAARWANQILDGQDQPGEEAEAATLLGLPPATIAALWQRMLGQLEQSRAIAATFTHSP
ncbi:MAG: HDOD domain-containing protein [Rhodocyclaceae bacterium]|nr:HDOD domain-containing protein [Rhodocyclaceae bacterium]